MEEDINPNRPEEVHSPPKGEPAAEHSFDELAKGLANRSLSRGDALKWAGRALAGALVASIPGIAWAQNSPQAPSGQGGPAGVDQYSPQAPSGSGGPGPEQASPQTPTTQQSAVGDNSTFCGKGYCYPPKTCVKGGGSPRCVCLPENDCSGTCVDKQTDPANCGGCGRLCTGGRTCQNGACGCPSGTILCGDNCVNTQSDNSNCGGCGIACKQGETCQGGSCKVPCGYNSYCNSGETCCGNGVCANPSLNQVCCTVPYYYYFRSNVCDLNLGEVCCPDVGVCANTSLGQVCCIDDLYYGTGTGYCVSGQMCCPYRGCVNGPTCS